jgi:hypothetical protein
MRVPVFEPDAFGTSRGLTPSANRLKTHALLEVSEWRENVRVILGFGPWEGGGGGSWNSGQTAQGGTVGEDDVDVGTVRHGPIHSSRSPKMC